MLGSGPSAVHGGSGALAPVLIPMRFVWPYGGRTVFLSGSFTRWLEHIPMMPVEGCPTVFQVIYSLTPGYHQYKFFVDGEWRHDECQPFVTGNYGVVNTIFIGGETETTSPSFAPPTPSRSLMDVDNSSFLHGEDIPRVSEADLQVSRHRISVFLASHTAYELLPESGKVIALDVTLPVKQAFHMLYEHGIPLAPLWDCSKGQLVGVLSALDFILILRELGTHGSNLTEEELQTHTIAAWKEGKHLNKQMGGGSMSYPRQFIHAGPFDSLKDVTLKILQHKVSTVPIIHSSSPDGSFPELLHLASLSEILKCICRYFKHSAGSLPILQQPICSMPLGTWLPNVGQVNGRAFAMLRSNASLSAALSLLVQVGLWNFSHKSLDVYITDLLRQMADVSSIPVVDDNDSLLDIYSRSDITSLAKDRAYAMIHLDGTTIHQALQLGQDANPAYGFFNGQRCQMCLRTDSLHKVMERLANPGVRRVVVVEAGSKRVEGVISLSDIFGFLLC